MPLWVNPSYNSIRSHDLSDEVYLVHIQSATQRKTLFIAHPTSHNHAKMSNTPISTTEEQAQAALLLLKVVRDSNILHLSAGESCCCDRI